MAGFQDNRTRWMAVPWKGPTGPVLYAVNQIGKEGKDEEKNKELRIREDICTTTSHLETSYTKFMHTTPCVNMQNTCSLGAMEWHDVCHINSNVTSKKREKLVRNINLNNLLLLLLLHLFIGGGREHVPQCEYGGLRTTCSNWFSLPTIWVLVIELRCQALWQASVPVELSQWTLTIFKN